jgi:hypothetical protein
MAKNNEDLMLEKLDQILRVLSIQVGADKSITERAWLLKIAGLDNKTIAEVLNTDVASIRTLISRSKKLSK